MTLVSFTKSPKTEEEYMKEGSAAPKNIDEYIAGFPDYIQKLLDEIRATIRQAAPDAEEAISYQMPVYKLNGILVYFAAYKNHIGFYPTSSATEVFMGQLSDFKCSKGTIRLPLDKPLPLSLITDIVIFRVEENMTKAEAKKKKQIGQSK
jgi:uncharacterized protein YdhG (YjbR/CyaY superfamily)